MINTKKDRKNLYMKLDRLNLIKKFKSLLNQGYHLRMEDGKFEPNNPAMGEDAPWVYIQTVVEARCDVYHRVFFNELGYVPSYCRECYKVVARPRNLIEQFDAYEFMKNMGVSCKLGIEKRPTTHNLYGCYFYNRGLDEGLERYEEVRALVDEHLSKETPVILKRACTEFEIGPTAFGPSDEWPDCTEEEIKMEEYILANFPRVGFGSPQPDHLTASVMQDWIHHAYRYGDDTYKEFTDGGPLFPPYITYHDKKTKRKK